MIDALKTLFENDVVSEDIRAQIEEAWDSKIKSNKMQVTAELREEFAKKYEHDKGQMVESIDSMLSERLNAEISEFAEDRKQLAEAKAKYAVAMRENADLMKGFVMQQLGKEVTELHEDQKVMSTKFGQLEEFVVEALAKEINEFSEDKKDLAETKVRLVKEAKTHFNKVKTNFIEKSAKLVSETVSKNLNKEIATLKEDIEVARQNDFGRKLFESFASEYANSYLNEKSETAKLMKVLDTKNRQLSEAKTIVEKTTTLSEAKSAEIKQINESVQRKEIMHDLIAPLGKAQREIMTDLLESVQTPKLKSAFSKYLPTVIEGNSPAKKKAQLTEGKAITGNKEETNVSRQKQNENVVDIRRLAGLN
tara:strand:- start:163 stop:1257 length:1095 start_codon:yes stop_codon:yes gene_type:complete